MSKRERIYPIILELFYALGLGLVIFTIMELIAPRIVLGYLNLSVWFVLWLVSGIIILTMNRQNYN